MSDALWLNALWNPIAAIAPPVDLTGVNSQYYHADDQYATYITGAQIFFDQTLYQQGLVITPVGSETAWVYGTDWTVTEADIDTVTLAQAVALLPEFSLTLLQSVTILHAQSGLPLFLSIASQSFYPRPENLPPLPDADNALTALLQWIVTRLNAIETEVNQVAIVTSGGSLTPILLAFDLNETISANLITAEPYEVNTYSGQNLIRPIQGSFFKDSLVLTAGGTTLIAGTDYQAVCVNVGKTTRTVNPSGIYDFILLTYDYAGVVQVTYHAVGGEATVTDLSAVYQTLMAIKAFLNGSGFLTTDQLLTTPALQNILKQMVALENQMRVLLSGTPNYGDSTNGLSVVKYLRAPDTGLHWYTVGKLYLVSGSLQIITTDRMSLHIQLVNSLLTADVKVTVDLRQTNDILTVTTDGMTQDVEFVPYGTIGTPAHVVIPQFRVVWNNPTTYVSGALLQIGLNLPNLTDTLVIEDRSGVESCWILDTTLGTSGAPLTPIDNTFVLPDGSSVWSSGVTPSTSAIKTMPNELGYLIWSGSKSLATFDSTIGEVTVANVLPSWFLIQDITEIIAEFEDASSNPLRVVFPMTGLTATVRRGIGIVYLGQNGLAPVPMEITLSIISAAIVLQIEVHASVQTAPITNLLLLVAKLSNSNL